MLDEKDRLEEGPHYMYVTDRGSFMSHDEAAADGPIRHTWLWCDVCIDWCDLWYDPQAQQDRCYVCSAADREQQAQQAHDHKRDLAALKAWESGLPLSTHPVPVL